MTKILLAGLAFLSAPALASSHYLAQPASPADARVVAKDVLWKCGDSGCGAERSNSRPDVICASLARQVGKLSRFSVAGAEFTPDQLEKCNAKAG